MKTGLCEEPYSFRQLRFSNRAKDNDTRADGIALDAENFAANGKPVGGSLIEGNTTNGNLGDDISVGGAGHTITNNAAHNNAAFGIRAAEGKVDAAAALAQVGTPPATVSPAPTRSDGTATTSPSPGTLSPTGSATPEPPTAPPTEETTPTPRYPGYLPVVRN